MELDREASGRITTAERIRYGRDRNDFDGTARDASVGLATSPSPPGRRLMLRLRNTLTRHVDPVEPLEPGRVRMYTCGPTVYRYAHVGNLRSNLLADLIRQDAALPRPRRPPRQEHHRRRPPARRGVRSWRRSDARPGRARIEDAGRDRRRVRGGLPRRRGAGQHPAGPRLPAGDRAHRGDARAGRGARGRRLCLRDARGQRLLRRGGVRRLRAAVGQHPRRPARRPPRRHRAGQARPGRLRALEGGRAGPAAQVADRRAGARASRAGTSSARRWRCATSGRASTSTPAASTTSSRTTRTRSRSPRRSSATSRRVTGSTGSSC